MNRALSFLLMLAAVHVHGRVEPTPTAMETPGMTPTPVIEDNPATKTPIPFDSPHPGRAHPKLKKQPPPTKPVPELPSPKPSPEEPPVQPPIPGEEPSDF